MIIISPLILRSLSLTSVFFYTTVLSSDEPDGQEERKLKYLDQEKLSYITNYLEQTRDTDVHSVSTEDDSGKAASNSAPSEFGFEETSGMTQSIPRVPNPSPFSICQLPQAQGGGHLSSVVFPGILHRDQFMAYLSGKNAGEEEKPSSCLKSVREICRTTR